MPSSTIHAVANGKISLLWSSDSPFYIGTTAPLSMREAVVNLKTESCVPLSPWLVRLQFISQMKIISFSGPKRCKIWEGIVNVVVKATEQMVCVIGSIESGGLILKSFLWSWPHLLWGVLKLPFGLEFTYVPLLLPFVIFWINCFCVIKSCTSSETQEGTNFLPLWKLILHLRKRFMLLSHRKANTLQIEGQYHKKKKE